MLLSSHIRKLNNVFSQFLQVSSYIFVDDVSCDIVHNRPFRGGVAASEPPGPSTTQGICEGEK